MLRPGMRHNLAEFGPHRKLPSASSRTPSVGCGGCD
jgi:hypothetical protein